MKLSTDLVADHGHRSHNPNLSAARTGKKKKKTERHQRAREQIQSTSPRYASQAQLPVHQASARGQRKPPGLERALCLETRKLLEGEDVRPYQR